MVAVLLLSVATMPLQPELTIIGNHDGSNHEGFVHFGKHMKTKSVSAVSPLLFALRDDTVDRILLAPGRYTVGSTLVLKRSVVLEAEVAGTVVLRGNSSCPFGVFEGDAHGDPAHGDPECKHVSERVIDVPPGVLSELQLEFIGLNITGGYAVDGNGGGIRISGGRARFTNCNIYENVAQTGSRGAPSEDTPTGGGGGLAIEGAAVVNFTGCNIHNNNVLGGSGAGVLIRGGTARFSRCKISHNGNPPHFKVPVRRAGGGLRIEGGAVVVDGCSLNSNRGSGLAMFGESTVLVNDSKIYDNNATEGGGVHQASLASVLTIETSKIYRNNATAGGGLSVGNASISDSEIFANAAVEGGGLYVTKKALVVLTGSQIYENKAASAGGGAFVFHLAKAVLTNSTVKENAVSAGHGKGSGSGIYAHCSSTVRLIRDSFVSNPPKSGGDDVFVQHVTDPGDTDAKAYCSARPAMDLAVTSVCIEEDVAGQTIIRTSRFSANVSVQCPEELDDPDGPSASGCLTGRSCAPATLGAVLIVFLIAVAGGLVLCGCYYHKKADTDEASGLVSGKPSFRCDPGSCIIACIGLCVRDEPKPRK